MKFLQLFAPVPERGESAFSRLGRAEDIIAHNKSRSEGHRDGMGFARVTIAQLLQIREMLGGGNPEDDEGGNPCVNQ